MKLQIVCAMLFALAVCAESEYIDGSYIILLKDGSSEAHIEEVIQKIEDHTISSREEMEITSFSSVLPIVFGKFDKETAEMVSGLESVKLVEQDELVPYESSEKFSIGDEVYNSTEGSDLGQTFSVPNRNNLDILDNTGCIDGDFTPVSSGEGVDIYILDSGIKYDHEDFGGRASFGGYDLDQDNLGNDQAGPGTHCAGIAGGKYSGVAKEANLLSIRIRRGFSGVCTSNIVMGMDHAYQRHVKRKEESGFKGSVISISPGRGHSWMIDYYVKDIVNNGVTIVTASGGNSGDACNYSPGSAGTNINVGAHGYSTSDCQKPMLSWSNYGKCVDIVAPGVDVMSAVTGSKNSYYRISSTSAACPHVSGVAATMLSEKEFTPAQIKSKIQSCSINDLSDRKDSTQRLYATDCLLK